MAGKDITGRKFGKLTAIAPTTAKKQTSIVWTCRCECGNTKLVACNQLTSGRVRSCGCSISKVGADNKTEYRIYSHMKSRCLNENDAAYTSYGGRGINVCDRWLEPNGQGFKNFLQDMGKRPSPNYSLDRKNNDGPYSPENCRWATRVTQNRNRRLPKNNVTGFPGVHSYDSRYRVRIRAYNKNIHLGIFNNLNDAISCRIYAELKYWGQLSCEATKYLKERSEVHQ